MLLTEMEMGEHKWKTTINENSQLMVITEQNMRLRLYWGAYVFGNCTDTHRSTQARLIYSLCERQCNDCDKLNHTNATYVTASTNKNCTRKTVLRATGFWQINRIHSQHSKSNQSDYELHPSSSCGRAIDSLHRLISGANKT